MLHGSCVTNHEYIFEVRKRKVGAYLKTEIDQTAIDLYKKFKVKAPSVKTVPPPEGQRDDYDDIRAFLNICELIAVGIKKKAFSKSVSKAYWGDIIPDSYRTAEELIIAIRKRSWADDVLTGLMIEPMH